MQALYNIHDYLAYHIRKFDVQQGFKQASNLEQEFGQKEDPTKCTRPSLSLENGWQ